MDIIKLILKRFARLAFKQVFYLLAGIFLLVIGILNRDWTIGALSLLFLFQGIFNTCLFGPCAIP